MMDANGDGFVSGPEFHRALTPSWSNQFLREVNSSSRMPDEIINFLSETPIRSYMRRKQQGIVNQGRGSAAFRANVLSSCSGRFAKQFQRDSLQGSAISSFASTKHRPRFRRQRERRSTSCLIGVGSHVATFKTSTKSTFNRSAIDHSGQSSLVKRDPLCDPRRIGSNEKRYRRAKAAANAGDGTGEGVKSKRLLARLQCEALEKAGLREKLAVREKRREEKFKKYSQKARRAIQKSESAPVLTVS